MKIMVLNGSPHKEGTTVHLLERFITGAKEAGNKIVRFDTAFLKVHPCMACNHCGNGDRPCVFADDMMRIYPELETADGVVLASPIYYFGLTAQLKSVIDRFYGIDKKLLAKPKKSVLITCAADPDREVFRGIIGTYERMLHYLPWEDCGRILAAGCADPEALNRTKYLEEAYHIGEQLR